MNSIGSMRRNCAGVALLTALGMLFLFATLGAAFITFMTAEVDGTRLEVKNVRAREAARGGVEAALGEIQDAIAANRAPRSSFEIPMPVYATSATAGNGLRVREDMSASAEIQIVSETPERMRIISKGTCGSVGPGGDLFHKSSIAAEAQAVFAGGKIQITNWSEHAAQ